MFSFAVEQLPWEVRKYLRWKMSTITPNVIKNCVARSSFRYTKSKNSSMQLLYDIHVVSMQYTEDFTESQSTVQELMMLSSSDVVVFRQTTTTGWEPGANT